MKRVYESLTLVRGMRAVVMVTAVCFAWSARADHAITQDRKGLFNVIVDDTITTWSRPLKVRYRPESFGYDFDNHTPYMLPGRHGDYFWIGDYVTTRTTVLSTDDARGLMRRMGWHKYEPPPTIKLVPFTPAPKTPTPEPTQIVGEGELADPSLPIGDRIQQQLEKFIAQQKELAASIEFAVKVQNFDTKKGTEMRLQLLDRQIKILQENYNESENLVAKALEALRHQRTSVAEKGTFTHELMHGL